MQFETSLAGIILFVGTNCFDTGGFVSSHLFELMILVIIQECFTISADYFRDDSHWWVSTAGEWSWKLFSVMVNIP